MPAAYQIFEAANLAMQNPMRPLVTKHRAAQAGSDGLKFWLVDSGVVFQRFVVDCGGL